MERKFTISQLEKITGIKAHTIRIWEKRYNILQPKRTETNIRNYDEQDLKKLLMIVALYKRGMRISELAKLPKERLQELIQSYQLPSESQTVEVEQLLIAITDFNQQYFESLIVREIINNGTENTMEKIIFPFLQKVEVLWLTDVLTCLHYDFAFNQVTKFLWQNLKIMTMFCNSFHSDGLPHSVFGLKSFGRAWLISSMLPSAGSLTPVCTTAVATGM